MPEAAQDYHSFLLRLWQTVEGGRLVWRASLEDVKSGEIHRFTSMDLLVEYLHERAGLNIGGNGMMQSEVGVVEDQSIPKNAAR